MTAPLQISGEASSQEIAETSPQSHADLGHLGEIPLTAELILGELDMALRTIAGLRAGLVLKTDRPVGEPLDLRVNTAKVALTEVYPIGDRIGARVIELHKDL